MNRLKILEKFKKIILSLIVVITLCFAMPIRSEAGTAQWVGNTLGQPIMQFAAMIGDVGMGILHKFVLNNNYSIMNSVMLDPDNQTVKSGDLSLNPLNDYNNDGEINSKDTEAIEKDKNNAINLTGIEFDGKVIGTEKNGILGDTLSVTTGVAGAVVNTVGGATGVVGGAVNALGEATGGTSIPNIMVSPEYIFSNRIALLDVDFVNPTTYLYQDGKAITAEKDENGKIIGGLQPVIASWYRAFRNIAIVAMLTILVYIGIRILIGSTAQDKAKYKERLQDWLVGLCLIFVMHYIMAGTLMVTKGITNLLSEVSPNYVVKLSGNFPEAGSTENDFYVRENITGYVRLMAQQTELADCFAYVVMYIVLVIFTYMFLIKYIKRVLYMAFFTMIAPLVAMTYPLDKLADGKSQGFSMWFKEYLMNALIQPVHLILYTVFVSSAASLARDNLLYSIVALGFLIPAEKFIKSMFRLDKGQTTGTLGDIAGGALALQGMKSLSNAGKSFNKSSSGGGSSSNNSSKDNKIRVNKSDKDYLSTLKGDNESEYKLGTLDAATQENEHRQGFNNGLIDDETQRPSLIGDSNSEESNRNNNMIDSMRFDNALDGNNYETPENIDFTNNMGQDSDGWTNISNDAYSNSSTDGIDINNSVRNSQFDNDNIGDLDFVNGMTSHHFRDMYNPNAKSSTKKEEEPMQPRSKWSAVKGTAARGARAIGNGIYNNRRRIIKGAVGTLARAAVGAVGATIGLAAGISTGDPSKAFAYTTGGYLAGRTIGNKATNAGEALFDTSVNAGRAIQSAYTEERYGIVETERRRKEAENKKAKKAFMKDSSEIARYKELAAKTGNNNYQELMDRAWDYKEAGISDNDKIATGLKLEAKHGNMTHDQMIGVMQLSKSISEDTILDDRRRKAFQESLTAKLGDEQKAQEVAQLAAESVEQGEFFKNKTEQEKLEKQWAASAAREKEENARIERIKKENEEKERIAAEKKAEKERIAAEKKAEEDAKKAKKEAQIQQIFDSSKEKKKEYDAVKKIRNMSTEQTGSSTIKPIRKKTINLLGDETVNPTNNNNGQNP